MEWVEGELKSLVDFSGAMGFFILFPCYLKLVSEKEETSE